MLVQWAVDAVKQIVELLYFSIYPGIFSVHCANKAVSNLRNNYVETEKKVWLTDLLSGILGVVEAVVKRG